MQEQPSTAIDLAALFAKLFPICRSITGPGIRSSLKLISDEIPLDICSVATGTPVLDWNVPPEWELIRARLWGPDGELLIDSDDNNLHVLNFSEPFAGEMDLVELQSHLFSLPELPDAIPYVTSYYNPRWGLCLSHTMRQSLRPGRYRVDIRTEKKPGVLNYGVTELPGSTDQLVLISSYLCHPSLANNELSGPLVLVRVWEHLSKRKNRRFTYRFLIAPETIGSITYLAHHGDELRRQLHGGFVLTCLGGPMKQVSFKLSRRDWIGHPTALDKLARHLASADPDRFAVRPFSPTGGSDERQFCSPGFNLPVIQAARTIYGEYAGYHSSADDLNFMTLEAVETSSRAICAAIDALEYSDCTFMNRLPYGEPQLGKRGLYPTLNGPMSSTLSADAQQDNRRTLNLLLQLLSLADGTRSLIQIAEHVSTSLVDLLPIVRVLCSEGILEEVAS